MDNTKKELFDLFEIEKIDPLKGEELLNRMSKIIFQSVLVRVLPTLTEEQQAKYDEIIENGKEEDLFLFLRDNVQDFDEIIKEEANILKKELTNN